MLGVLNVRKPTGPTSRDVVGRVHAIARRGLGVKKFKVGHAGTLDPLADGVLGICLGRATRLIDYLQAGRKEYVATFRFGVATDSHDLETELRPVPGGDAVTPERIASALPRFVGTITQRPPDYSAVRVDGKRAFDLARDGQQIDIAARDVRVDAFELLEFEPGGDGPTARLAITCGAGTYVRSLGRDLAAALGTGAVMTALTRTRVGPLTIDDAVDFESLTFETIRERLLPPETALVDLPRLDLDEISSLRFRHGNDATGPWDNSGPPMRAVFGPGEKLLGVGRIDPDSSAVSPRVVLEPPNGP